MDRSHFTVAKLSDPDDAVAYWLTRPVDERLQALELLRMTFYGYTETGPRLQVTQLRHNAPELCAENSGRNRRGDHRDVR